MRSNEERITRMHERLSDLKHQREKRIITACTALSSMLCICLIGVIAMFSQPSTGYSGAEYAGASLVDGSVAGGYVITALIAFILGILLTVLIMKYKEYKTI